MSGICLMEEQYIDCDRCANWTLEYKQKSICSTCKNTRQRINPKTILCNMCGESLCHDIKTKSGRWHSDEAHGLIGASVMGGYESYHLLDMTSYTFNMCELCLRKMFNQFVIKPKVADNDFSGNSTPEEWERDQESYEYRVWKDEGGFDQAYLNRQCNIKKNCPNTALYTILFNGDYSKECSCEDHKDVHKNNTRQFKITKFIPDDLRAFL